MYTTAMLCVGGKELIIWYPIRKLRQQRRLIGEEAPQNQRKKDRFQMCIQLLSVAYLIV